jgi:hypothetical protein
MTTKSAQEMRLRKKMPGVMQAIDDQGWTVSLSRRGHIKITPPDQNVRPLYTSGTPSDYRSDKNFVAQLQRLGLKLHESIVHEYIAPKEIPLSKETIAAQLEVEKKPLPEQKFMTMRQVVAYLGEKSSDVIEWREANFLPEAHNPNGHHRGRYFLTSDVEAFAASEEYIELRGGPKRQMHRKKNKLVMPPEPVLVEDPAVIGLRMVVTRRSTKEMTLEELAEAVANAIAPRIQDLVTETMRQYFKGIEW